MVFWTLGRRQGDAKVNEMGEESVITSERRFRRATMADLPTMLKIYEHARKLMASNGNPTQWVISSLVRKWFVTMSNRNAPCCLSIRLMARNVCSPSSHCVRHRPTYVNIDGAWLDDDPYVTIHRIASSGLAKGAAKDCINWCIEHYGNVRADTHPNNKAMQHVLESNGFARCGLIQLLDRPSDTTRIAYQRHEW